MVGQKDLAGEKSEGRGSSSDVGAHSDAPSRFPSFVGADLRVRPSGDQCPSSPIQKTVRG